MDIPRKDRKAEYSIATGLIAGGVIGAVVSAQLFGEPGAGFLIGAGIGLVLAASYCGLAGN